METISDEEISKLQQRLKEDAEKSGYHLNPDEEMTRDLVRGLITNEKRHGYRGCPCRLSADDKQDDLDIICPCDYRDPDLGEYGMCYCALYVSGEILQGVKEVRPIPERRPPRDERAQNMLTRFDSVEADSTMSEHENAGEAVAPGGAPLGKPVWRCRVCGYLCGRDDPPEVCPICGAKKERFERFM
ncbi:MAG: ferredoxin-thioredoxin reductase catalytic domain-containing protein [Thermoleophilia bacterium]|nr:ferredoxin-thioredoxin reductase catalytic domain-containing protein [Thermoleophilia bacterium]